MNPFIKEQLNLVHIATLPKFDEDTTKLYIPKTIDNYVNMISPGKTYILELANYITNPSENFNLHDNWNNGNIPKYTYLKCYVESVVGRMIKVKGSAIDTKTMTDIDYSWDGWLPYKSITVIKEIQ